eukprot:1235722-Lingulodinium_polyedra.AAC.1
MQKAGPQPGQVRVEASPGQKPKQARVNHEVPQAQVECIGPGGTCWNANVTKRCPLVPLQTTAKQCKTPAEL